MGFKQQGLAVRLGVDVQTVANYEKGRKIPTTPDRFIRVLFVLWAAPPDARAEVIKQLTEAVQHSLQPVAHRNVPADLSPAFVKQWQMCVDCHV
jgi:transcriptional regulator with XRE-family HTH domain